MSDDDDGVYQSASNREQGRKRRVAVAGVVALAALLGGGAYLVTAQIADRNRHTEAGDPLAPPITPASGGIDSGAERTVPATASPKPTISTKNAVKQSLSPSPSPIPTGSMSVDEQIRAAQEKAAREGYPVQRALTPAPGVVAAEAVEERTEETPTGTLRIVTARSDLTGQRELLWAADKGKRHGDITCTQNFKFGNNNKPTIRPNMLLCWATSAKKSVVTVLVDRGGKPSTAESAEVISREWARLG